jgi:hypothetical protein
LISEQAATLFSVWLMLLAHIGAHPLTTLSYCQITRPQLVNIFIFDSSLYVCIWQGVK